MKKPTGKPPFLPVHVTNNAAIEIELPNQAVVRLPLAVESHLLNEAVLAAGRCGESPC